MTLTDRIIAAAPATKGTNMEFRPELERLLNRHSMENGSNTPDFILADFLIGALAAFDSCVARREEWYGRNAEDGPGRPVIGVDHEVE